MSISFTRMILTAITWMGTVGASFAVEHLVPPPRTLAEVEAMLAQTPPTPAERTLEVVLLAGPKDHGLFEHDYPLWQKRWKVLLGGVESGDEPIVNAFGAPLPLGEGDLTGAEGVHVTTAWQWPSPEQWKVADLVVMFSGPAWDPAHLAELDQFLQRGGGFVVVHMALWQDSPELAALIGLAKQPQTLFRHGPVRLELTDPKHPICVGLPPAIDLVDESYFNFQGDSSTIEVLATCPETRPGEQQVRNEPMFWTFRRGKGRVFVCIPGHFMWTFDDPCFRMLLLRGMAWAAGESPYRFDPLVLRGARVLRPAELEAPKAEDPDLLLWLDAGDRDTLTIDDAGRVSAWRNKVGGSHQVVTASGDQRPLWVASALGNRAAVRFDGNDDVLKDTGFKQSVDEWTLLLVTVPRSNRGTGIPDGFHGFFSANSPGGADYVTGMTIDMGGAESDRFHCLNVESAKGFGAANLLFAASNFGEGRVLAVATDQRQTTLYAESEPQLLRPANDSPISLAEIRIGSRFYHSTGETGFVDADIAEVLLYKTSLAPDRIGALSTHLQAKYGVGSLVVSDVPTTLDDALATLAEYQWAQSRLPLEPIDAIVRSGNRDAIADLERRLAAVLKGGVSPGAADYIARRLAIIGTESSVEALALLLGDESLAAIACDALQEIPAAGAGEALLSALPAATGMTRLAILQAVGNRRETRAVDELLPLLDSDDRQLADAAATALATIGDARAAEPLLKRRELYTAALLTLADRLVISDQAAAAGPIYAQLEKDSSDAVRAAVLAGRVAAEPAQAPLHLVGALRGENNRLRGQAAAIVARECSEAVAAEVLGQFASLPAAAQEVLLGQRWTRFPAQGRLAALSGIGSRDGAVRCAALALLALVGQADDVALLSRIAADRGKEAESQAARQTLRHLVAEGCDEALLTRLAAAPDAEQIEMIRTARDRRTAGAVPRLLELTGSPEVATRMAALEALETLGDASTAGQLIPRLLTAKTAQERYAAERAVWQCAERGKDVEHRVDPLLQAYREGSAAERAVLLPVLGRMGGGKALDLIHAAGKDRNEGVRAASVQALANWPDATVANELLELAQNADQPSYRIWALRGYIRTITLPGARTAEETLGLLERALPLATRPDELRLILDRLPAVVTGRSLEIAMKYVEDPTLGASAVVAAAQLAEALLPSSPDLVREAIPKILKVTNDPIVRARLQRAISKPM